MNRPGYFRQPLETLIPADHPARFVAEFVDALDRHAWIELGIGPDGEPLGAPAYHPRALLSVWLHGRDTLLPQAGGSLSRPGAISLANGMATSRPQHPLAILSGPPRSDAETAEALGGNGGRIGTG